MLLLRVQSLHLKPFRFVILSGAKDLLLFES